VIKGERVQINAYVMELMESICEFDDLDIEIRLYEYGSGRSSEELIVRDFKVLDHANRIFVNRSLDLRSNQMFYVLSLREDENYLSEDCDNPVIAYVTRLQSNFPNPFNPETTIAFSLSNVGNVVINVYNVRGQRVRSLLDEQREPGHHSIVWNGRDDSGRALSSGIYLYRMTAGDFTETRRMLLMK